MELNGVKYNNAPRKQQRVHSHWKSRILNDNCMRNPARKTEKKQQQKTQWWNKHLKYLKKLQFNLQRFKRRMLLSEYLGSITDPRPPVVSLTLPPRLFKRDILMGLLVWEWAKGQPHTCFNHWAGVTKAHLWEATAKTIPRRGKLKSFNIATISAHLGSKFSNIHSTGHTGHLFHT